MPLRDLRGYFWDVAEACRYILAFTHAKTLDDYLADRLLRSAVERQLTIAGEALAQATRHFPDVDSQISEARKIVAFRNRIVHAYLEIDDETVWGIVERYVPELLTETEAVLLQLGSDEDVSES
jgi:uncharacterized protein with HEPN domain